MDGLVCIPTLLPFWPRTKVVVIYIYCIISMYDFVLILIVILFYIMAIHSTSTSRFPVLILVIASLGGRQYPRTTVRTVPTNLLGYY